MKRVALIGILSFAFSLQLQAQTKITKEQYVEQWSRVAMNNMIEHKIPASITLAQGILESGSGNSDLARQANNHFGIKCHDWKGEKIYKDDDQKNECFRKYQSADLSFEDHSAFLKKARYANLFNLDITDYKGWAKGLKAAGYATNPKYPELLIGIIEDLKLYEIDRLVTNSPSKGGNVLTKKEESKQTSSKPSETKTSTTVKEKTKVNSGNKAGDVEVVLGAQRSTSIHTNKVKYIVAKKGDTYYKIAEEFGMTLGQIHKYNDVKYGKTTLKEGDIVNIHPKKAKGNKDFIIYNEDLTILEVAQREGLKVASLMKLNQLTSAKDIVKKGQKVALR